MGFCHSISNLHLNNLVVFAVLLLFISLSFASIHEDEDRINSEGMWQNKVAIPETKVSTGHGNSRFDVGGMLTAAGLKTGGSLLGLVFFPLVFPIVVLFAIALFVISIFAGATPLITGGRRSDNIANELDVTSYAADLANTVLGSEQCVERIGCEILDGIGHKTKILLRALRKLNVVVPPGSILEKVDIAITNGAGVGKSCSSHFKCGSVREFIAKAWEQSYAKYFT